MPGACCKQAAPYSCAFSHATQPDLINSPSRLSSASIPTQCPAPPHSCFPTWPLPSITNHSHTHPSAPCCLTFPCYLARQRQMAAAIAPKAASVQLLTLAAVLPIVPPCPLSTTQPLPPAIAQLSQSTSCGMSPMQCMTPLSWLAAYGQYVHLPTPSLGCSLVPIPPTLPMAMSPRSKKKMTPTNPNSAPNAVRPSPISAGAMHTGQAYACVPCVCLRARNRCFPASTYFCCCGGSAELGLTALVGQPCAPEHPAASNLQLHSRALPGIAAGLDKRRCHDPNRCCYCCLVCPLSPPLRGLLSKRFVNALK